MDNNLDQVAEKLKNEAQVMVITEGTSMQPMLRQHKDIVVIEQINRPIIKNDVLLYRVKSKTNLVLHRVLKVKEDHYVIRGDNTYVLEYIPKTDAVGVLKEFYRSGIRYNCAESKKYKAYVTFNRLTYPFRYLWKKVLKPKIKKLLGR